jgi:hypothetical protein
MSEGLGEPGATADLRGPGLVLDHFTRLLPVNLRELQGRALTKCPSRQSWAVALGFVFVMGPIVGFVTWGIWDKWHPPLLAFGPFVVVEALFGIYGAVLLFSMGFNHGIELSNAGVILYGPKILRPWLTDRFLIPWGLFREPSLVAPTAVLFRGEPGLFPWPLIQARVVLTDSRYPYSDQIPDDLRRKLET